MSLLVCSRNASRLASAACISLSVFRTLYFVECPSVMGSERVSDAPACMSLGVVEVSGSAQGVNWKPKSRVGDKPFAVSFLTIFARSRLSFAARTSGRYSRASSKFIATSNSGTFSSSSTGSTSSPPAISDNSARRLRYIVSAFFTSVSASTT